MRGHVKGISFIGHRGWGSFHSADPQIRNKTRQRALVPPLIILSSLEQAAHSLSDRKLTSGGVFKLELFLPEEYPMNPPKVRFLTKI